MKFIKQIIPAALVIAMSATADAATHVWSGATSQFMSTPSNWSAGGAPFAGETAVVLVFPASASPRTVIHNISGLTVDKITIDGGQTTLTGSGATLTFSNAGGSNLVTTNTGSKTNVIDSSLPVVLTAMTFFDTDALIDIRSVVSGFGGISSSGPLMLSGTGSNTYTGTTIAKAYLKLGKTAGKNACAGPLIVNGGYLINAASNQIPDNTTITLYNNGGYILNGFSETIGNLNLEAAYVNSEGATSILTLGGTVTVTEANPFIKGNIALSGTRTLDLALDTSLTLDGIVSNSSAVGGINKIGEGILNIPGANTFTGPVNLAAGEIVAKNASAFGTPAGGVTVGAGTTLSFTNDLDTLMAFGNETLNLAGTIYADVNTSWAGSIVLNGTASGFTGRTVNFDYREFKTTGVISGSGTLVKKGGGCLTLGGTASNTYTGATFVMDGKLTLFKDQGKDALTGPSVTVTGGVLIWAMAHQINDSTALIVNDGDLTPFWVTETIASLSGAGGLIHLSSGSLLIGANGIDTAFHGAFSGNGTVYKIGAGNMTLDQASANTMHFVVAAGILTVDGKLNCSVSVNPGGTLRGKGEIPQIYMNGGTVDLSQLNTGGLSVTGPDSTFISKLQGNSPLGGYGQTKVTGSVFLTGTSFYPTLGFVPYNGTSFTLIDNDGTDAVTGNFFGLPEGATFGLNGRIFTITYHGGSGNDVVITVTSGGLAPPVITSFVLGQANNNQRTADIDVVALPATLLGLQYSYDLKTWVDYAGKTATSNAQGLAHFHTSDNIAAKLFYRVYVK